MVFPEFFMLILTVVGPSLALRACISAILGGRVTVNTWKLEKLYRSGKTSKQVYEKLKEEYKVRFKE